MQALRVRSGHPYPLGATWLGRGTNFAIASESASSVELCLFDESGAEERIPLTQRTDFVWHALVDEVGPGQAYAYLVDGRFDPDRGLRFEPRRALLDPYAKAVSRTEDPSTPFRGLVVDPAFDWGDDAPPATPMRHSLLYRADVGALTARHAGVPPELRGTYLGLATDAVIDHLGELGVTAVELAPVHALADDPAPAAPGSPASRHRDVERRALAFFAPDARYRAGRTAAGEVTQFKRMVKSLHDAGVEVLLRIAFGRTAEGDHLGPTLSLRGIDNTAYYLLSPDAPRFYADDDGTGNRLNLAHRQALRLAMDCLRHWVDEMHVDGFRIDLSASVARSLGGADRLSAFFSAVHQDPVLGRVKLIADAWDEREHGPRPALPVHWAEQNRRYRDTVCAFWRGEPGAAADLGRRVTGSPDRYRHEGLGPYSGVNDVADASDDADADVVGRRVHASRYARNLLSTLFLSQGTPTLRAGDELGSPLRGDDAPSREGGAAGIEWELNAERALWLDFVRRVSRLRQAHPLLRRATFFLGRQIEGVGVPDLVWLRPDGHSMTNADWDEPGLVAFGLFASGASLEPVDERGLAQVDDDLLLFFNAGHEDREVVVPALADRDRAVRWRLALDTSRDNAREAVEPGEKTTLAGSSLKLFTRRALSAGGSVAVRGAPASTYRLQLQPDFGFRRALEALDYLDDLGAGALYFSPYFRAQHGSRHGYDVVDHAALNPELGTADEFRALSVDLRRRGMGHVVDFVPNHVGVGSAECAWWLDVLENGPSSRFADWFDIAWDAPERGRGSGRDKVLLPILGRQFGEEVEAGTLAVARDEGAFFVTYWGKRLPASPRSYALVLEAALGRLDGTVDGTSRSELESILAAIGHMPAASSREGADRDERVREKEVTKRRLAALCASSAEVARAIDAAAAAISGRPDRLERFLGEQNYRLSYWRVAADEINYRRFFDINELAAIRMEEPHVFAAAHRLLFDLVADETVTGIRLDHTDGLYDPYAYFHALQQGVRDALRRSGMHDERAAYVVAEKILEPGENLPRTWPISGTTGYDYIAAVNGLWVDPSAEATLTRAYAEFTGEPAGFRDVVRRAKRDVIDGSFASETEALSDALKRIAEHSRHTRDFTRATLTRVIRATLAAFPVYRTYVRPDGSREATDEQHIAEAVAAARRANPLIEASTFDFLEDVLLLRVRGEAAVAFAMRFQQLSGPVMAKGVEDTAVYRYARLVCLNEVGCDPSRFSVSPKDLHAHNGRMRAEWPLAMTALSTHDTKRSADVRARLAVLTELPDEWLAFVHAMHDGSAALRRVVDGMDAPSPTDEYLFYQTAAGAFPFQGLAGEAEHKAYAERVCRYMVKASHEAKLRTSWTNPNARYDQAVEGFVRGVLGDAGLVGRLSQFATRIASYGAANSLAQAALQLASPGVSDVYQGSELWSLALVDPDNRDPVDFGARRRVLAALRERGGPSPELARELVGSFADGRIKLHTTRLALRLRREQPALFLEGSYEPVAAPPHAVAFERRLGERRLVCVVPRLSAKLTGGVRPWALGSAWGQTRLELATPGRFRNVFTGEEVEGADLAMSSVLSEFPVAWLIAGSPGRGD